MISDTIEGRLGGVPDVLVHIGAGGGQLAGLARRCKRAVLVEPDPERFEELQAQVGQSSNVVILNNALAQSAGTVRFASASLRRFSSARGVTGAKTLYRGLKPAGETEVAGLPLADLVGEVSADQSLLLVLDAPSEGLLALEQAEAAKLLGDNAAVLIKITELALHDGGADRDAIEAWASKREYQLEPAAGNKDPDVWLAWLVPPARDEEAAVSEAPDAESKPSQQDEQPDPELAEKLARAEARNKLLEDRLESQAKLTQKHRSKAYRSQKQLEKAEDKLKSVMADADSVKQAIEAELKPLKREAQHLSSEVKRLKDALEVSTTEARAASRERDSLRERDAKSGTKLEELSQQVSTLRSDLNKAQSAEQALASKLEAARKSSAGVEQRLGEETKTRRELAKDFDALQKSASAAQADLKVVQDKYAKLEEHSDALKQRYEAERSARSDAETRIKALERELGQAQAETWASKTDMALILRTQNMVQSDLQDLQTRYDALAAEKQELEGLLSGLMDRLYDASDRVKALAWAEADSQSRSAPEAEQ